MTSAVVLTPSPQLTIRPRSSHSRWDSVLFYGTFFLLLFGPLAFGAVEPWSTFVLEAGAALLFALWAVRQVASGELRISGSPLFPPMLTFVGLILLQLVSRQTAYRAATLSAGLLYYAYGLLAFLAVQCLCRTWQVRNLGLAFSVYGFAIAVFALIQGLTSNGKLYWMRTPRFGGWLYGPYVNHNHYAGLMEMLVPIPLVISLSSKVHRRHRVMADLAALVMASTIFLSGSRGGMIAFLVEVLLLAIVGILRRTTGKAALTFSLFLVLACAALAWLGGGALAERMASIHEEAHSELSGGVRLTIDRDTLKMFAGRPVLGWGLGVFPEVYPRFRTVHGNVSIDRAHNDYLQLMAEMGSLGFIVMAWYVLVLFRCAIRKLKAWPPDTNAAVTLAAMLGVIGILVHSFVDFNLQISANAALFYTLGVIAAMEPRFGLHHQRQRKRSTPAEDVTTLGSYL